MSLVDDARTSFTESPRRRISAELRCFLLVFWMYETNNDSRKAVTILAVAVYALLELGAAFGYANLPAEFFYMRLFIGILIGRMWGIQFNNVAGLSFEPINSEDDSDE